MSLKLNSKKKEPTDEEVREFVHFYLPFPDDPNFSSVKNLFWYDEKNSLNHRSAQKNDKVIELWGDFVIFNWSFSDQTFSKGKKNSVKLSCDKSKKDFHKNHPIWWQMRLEGHRAKLIFHFYFPSKFFLWDVNLDQIWAIFWPWILWLEFFPFSILF